MALEQVFWHPTFDTKKMTKMRKNDAKMIDPKFIQNHSQEDLQDIKKHEKNNVEHPPEPLRDVLEK